MLDILKKEAKIGDKIKLLLITGQEPQGEILEISDSYVRLMTQEGQEARLFDKLIGGWEILESSKKEPQKEKTTEPKVVINLEDKMSKTPDQEELLQKTTKDDRYDKGVERPTLRGLKIVGKIDLDEIQSKYSKRKSEISKTNSVRLIRAAKDLNLAMSQIVELGKELSIEIEPKSSFLISEKDFQKIQQYHLSSEESENKKEEPISENKLKLNSLGDLKKLKEKITVEEGKEFLAPNGIVKQLWKHKNKGSLIDKDGKTYYFSFKSIADAELLERFENSGPSEEGTQVVCLLKVFNGRLVATEVNQSRPIEQFVLRANELYEKNEIIKCQELLLLILDSYPNYSPAQDLLNKIKYDRSKAKKRRQNASNSYFRAKTELSRGNLEEAKKYFEEALELTDHRVESVIKELAYLYQREGNWSKAVELVQENSKKFNSTDPNSFIAFFYESEKIYDKAVEFLEKVKSGSRNDNIKLIKRKANAYYRLEQYDQAEKLIQEVLKEQPEDRISQKIFEVLKKANISGKYGDYNDELAVIFNEAELVSFTGGLSPFAQYSLERCSFEGVPPADVRDEKFNKTTLRQLRSIIEKLGTKRPKDRASYLLTEAKLIDIIEPESESEKLSALTKYFTTYCDYSSIASPPVDIIRFFILEASRTSKGIDAISTHLPIYVYSFMENSYEAQKRLRTKIDVALKESLLIEQTAAWQGLADLFSTNSNVFSNLLTRLFSDQELKNRSVEYLNKSLNKSLSFKISKEEFKKAWTHIVQNRQLSKQRIQRQFQVLEETVSSEQFAESFNSLKKISTEALNQTDNFRIKTIDEIIDSVFDFNRQSDFEDKERMHNQVQNHVNQVIDDIENSPTEFSFNILRRILKKLSNLVQEEFIRLVASSSPELDITVAGEGILNQNKRSVNFQVLISNKKGSAPISSLEIIIEDSEDFAFNRSDNISNLVLKGGQERPMRLTLTMSRASTEISAIPLNVVCKYKIRGSEDEKEFSRTLTLRFYSEAEFERIDNPFATTADSGPVEDPSMFFGREEFLENVMESILGSGAKCIIIYGQKRSGKSSVLFHLRERLNQDSNAFCIQFSLGEIIEDLSSEVFYYKVLSEIEDALDILREDGYLVPEFECPDFKQIYNAPSIVFNDKLKELKKAMKRIEGWSNKKLVLLLDEFTYVYTAIKRDILSDQFMKSWKSFLEKGHFTSVLIGQDIMPKFTSAYPNEFGVTEPRRLSYLRKSDAKKLIEKPVWDTMRNQSRFIGNALELILDYTSSNPYYIQIFCARLVEHLNRIKAITATEADVEEVALSFIKGADALTVDKFDNLITAGDAEVEPFPYEQVLLALKDIALATKNLSSCSKETLKNKEAVTDEILEDLRAREVLDCPQTGYYRINVRLFKEWLLKN